MQEFLSRPLLDNTVGGFLWPVVILVLVIALRNHFSRIIAALCYRLIKRWTPGLTQHDFTSLLLKPLAYFLVFMVFVASIDHLTFPSILNFRINLLNTDMATVLNDLKIVVLTILFFWVILRLVDFFAMVLEQKARLTPQQSDDQIVIFFRDFIKLVVGFIGFIVIMKFLVGKEFTGKLVGALGIGAAALALAAKETIENLISSFIILLDKPFQLGDYIKVSGVSGVVEKVGLRSTRIRSDDKTSITIPNKQVADSVLEDVTAMTQRRVTLLIQLDASTESQRILDVLGDIREILTADQQVIDNFTLNLNDISQRSFDIQVIYYTSIIEWQAFNELKQRINLGIIHAIEARQIRLCRNIITT
jgi:MscS family membrane protein